MTLKWAAKLSFYLLSTMNGTLISRLIVSVFALPFLYFYLYWQSNKKGDIIHAGIKAVSLSEKSAILNEMLFQIVEAGKEIAHKTS